jgi:hypothetical protein
VVNPCDSHRIAAVIEKSGFPMKMPQPDETGLGHR